MRAVIRCHTNVETEALDALLSERDWWPNLPQDHEAIEERRREILSSNKLKHAINQRKIEATIGLLAVLGAILFSLLTIPSNKSPIFQRLSPDWYMWLSGFLERLATSAIVVAAISWLHPLLHWLSLRRKGLIRWSLD